jgi:hypothetical protein
MHLWAIPGSGRQDVSSETSRTIYGLLHFIITHAIIIHDYRSYRRRFSSSFLLHILLGYNFSSTLAWMYKLLDVWNIFVENRFPFFCIYQESVDE